jgi:hypothetical protein
MRNVITKNCLVCESEFEATTQYPRRETCSRKCCAQLRRARLIAKVPTPINQPETNTCLIPLSSGAHTSVDDCDRDVAIHKWSLKTTSDGKLYAHRRLSGERKSQSLHRVILSRIIGRDLSPTELCDHIDGNGLNNRRSNLRVATPHQNNANQPLRKDSGSGLKGVSWKKANRKWQAKIRVNRQDIHLGLFSDTEEAHRAYCEAARKYFGEFANDGNKQIEGE